METPQSVAPSPQGAPCSQPDSIYTELESYPFSQDPQFQSGLSSILSSHPNAYDTQVDHLTLRARCFYFARKRGISIDFAAYQKWREDGGIDRAATDHGAREMNGVGGAQDSVSGRAVTTVEEGAATLQDEEEGAAEPEAPYPVTFNQIVELIANGQPIPGIKDIPDTVLEGRKSQAVVSTRRKPWEKAATPDPETHVAGHAV